MFLLRDEGRTITLTTTGVKASVFYQESDGSDLRRAMMETDGDTCPIALARLDSPGYFFLLFLGDVVALSNWYRDNHGIIDHQYRSMLECTRDRQVKFMLDVEFPISASSNRDQIISDTRANIQSCIAEHLYKPLFKSKKAAKQGLRWYECHRPMEDGDIKISFHVFSRDIAMDCIQTAGMVARFLVGKFPAQMMGVDTTIYTRGRILRLPGAWKSATDQAVFTIAADQAATAEVGDAWATDIKTTPVYTAASLMKELKGFGGHTNSRESIFLQLRPYPNSQRVGLLNDHAGEILGKMLTKKKDDVTFSIKISGDGLAFLDATNSFVCVTNPEHVHSSHQGNIVVRLLDMFMMAKCWGGGRGCGCHPLVFDSPAKKIACDIAVLQAVDHREVGIALDDPVILSLFPPSHQDWRRVSTETHQHYLVSRDVLIGCNQDTIAILHKSHLAAYDPPPFPLDARKLLVLLNENWCYQRLGSIDMPVIDPDVAAVMCAKSEQNSITVQMMNYLEGLFHTRGYVVSEDGSLYCPSEKRPHVYDLVLQPSKDGEKDPDAIARFLTHEIETHGDPTYLKLLRHWSPSQFGGFYRKMLSNVGNRFKHVQDYWCYAFTDGILFIPKIITAENADVNTWFETDAEMAAAGRPCVMPIRCFDIKYDRDWTTNADGFHSINKIMDDQGWDQAYKNLVLAMLVGRPVMRWTLGAKGDRAEQNIVLTGTPGCGKSVITNTIKELFPSGTVAELGPRGSTLACKQHLRDSHPTRLIVSTDLNNVTLDFFIKEFDVSDFRKTASGEPVPVSRLHKTQVSEVITSAIILVMNNSTLGWHAADRTQKTIDAINQRIFIVSFEALQCGADHTLEDKAKSDEELASLLVYGLQQYVTEHQKGMTRETFARVERNAINRERMMRESSPLHSYMIMSAEGRSLDKTPILVKTMGKYITPTQLRAVVRDYLATNQPGIKSIPALTMEDIESAIAGAYDTDSRPMIAKPDNSQVQQEINYVCYCGDCFAEGRFKRRSNCDHVNSSRGARPQKVPIGSILNHTLRVVEESY